MKELDDELENKTEQLDLYEEIKKVNDLQTKKEKDEASEKLKDKVRKAFSFQKPFYVDKETLFKVAGVTNIDENGIETREEWSKKAYADCGFHTEGLPRNFSIFIVFLTGQKNLSIEEAARITSKSENFDQYLKEYKQALIDHPVEKTENNNLSDKQIEENSKFWAKMFMNSSQKLAEYTLPDMTSELDEEKKLEVGFIFSAAIDVVQEFEGLSSGKRSQYVNAAAGGDNKLNDAMKPWNYIRLLSNSYNATSYGSSLFNGFQTTEGNINPASINTKLTDVANSRAHFESVAKSINNKKIKEAAYSNANELERLSSIYMQTAESQFKQKKADAKDAIDYLAGKNTKFIEDREKNNAQVKEVGYKYLNSALNLGIARDIISAFNIYTKTTDLDYKNGSLASINDKSLSNEKKYELLSKDNNVSSLISKSIAKLGNSSSETADFNKLCGHSNYLDYIKIDDKTPEQLWGDKYNDVTDASKKNYLLQCEVANQILNGGKTVLLDIYIVEPKTGEIKQIDPVPLARNKFAVEKMLPFYQELFSLENSLTETYQALINTQSNKEANTSKNAPKEGSKEYQNMLNSLKNCIDSVKAMDWKEIQSSIKEFKKNSKIYRNTHDNRLFKGRSKNKGKVRLDISKKYADSNLTIEFEKLRELKKYIKLPDPECYDSSINYNLKFNWEDITNQSRYRGTNISKDNIAGYESILKTKTLDDANKRAELKGYLNESIKSLTSQAQKAAVVVNNLDGIDWTGKKVSMTDVIKAAKKVVKKQYYDIISTAGLKKNNFTLDDISLYMKSPMFKKEITSSVDALINDDKFIKCVQNNPKDYMKKWKAIDDKRTNKLHNFLAETDEHYQAVSKKCGDPLETYIKYQLQQKGMIASDYNPAKKANANNIDTNKQIGPMGK
ncbi:MAG: hypothetical protein K5656_08070 [Lachnospiraceae bacterium]|nr:hypothetical protein [Lachnospiraceae bacterium]